MCNSLFPVQPLRSGWLTTIGSRHIPDKLELKNTTLISSSKPLGQKAKPYLVLDDNSLSRSLEMGMTDEDIMSSAGGIRSTGHNMLTRGNALLSPFHDNLSPSFVDPVLSGYSFGLDTGQKQQAEETKKAPEGAETAQKVWKQQIEADKRK
ncbi:hypothetical protein FBEOM_2610 [Fusarium beomiforme]|uniref:Uncharacterized protein n=1 Tax=Fusarium beomiforme TaxID=44412 RepID=A0A9P5E354_9HYPO|nr:hypothetical protein FBEOM_2610 [Fusarium beomiforme]